MQYLAFLILSLLASLAAAEPPTLDWSDVSESARIKHSPILVVFSAETCGYCMKLKHEVIEPLFNDPKKRNNLLIREFDINAGGKIVDFNGEPIRSRQFKRRYGIFATPTLLILDAEGHPLTDPLVGYNSANEYRELLHASLVDSYRALK
ncbi:MAG: thioredoxin fold domain-containing protein [Candidatus Thiodiazotropha sp.]|jgi:thioredoxin-related protein